MRALRAGARVVEHPTHEYPRRFGRSSLSVPRQGLLFLGVYLRECIRPVRGAWPVPEAAACGVAGEAAR